VKVPVIDNGGQWTHREYRVLRDLGVETEIVPNTQPIAPGSADGVVLSGGALSLEGKNAPLGVVGEWIDSFDGGVLGICVGHQFLGRHFGGTVARAKAPEFGRVGVEVDRPDHPIFAELPAHLTVWSSHNDHVVRLPDRWVGLAHSASSPFQAMAHPTRPIIGVQFHPEVEHTVGGVTIFRNFLKVCQR
jgi:GMP synthase (glutamine-hydrolysing)